jgi:P pilus assembly chaperone PapD
MRHFAAALIAVLAIAPFDIASAQLTVDRVEAVIHPSNPAERETIIHVRNDGSKSVQAVIRLEDWKRTSDGTNQWFPGGTQAGSCGKLLTIFPLAANLDPGASQSIRIVLDTAAARPSSECWSAAVVETVSSAVKEGKQVGYFIRTAVKLYVQPVGLRADGEIPSMRVIADSVRGADSVKTIEVEFENTGDRHIVAQGVVEFRRPDNTVAARISLPNVYSLPKARQLVRAELPRLAAGRYVVLATLDFGGDEIAASQIEYEVVR